MSVERERAESEWLFGRIPIAEDGVCAECYGKDCKICPEYKDRKRRVNDED